MCNAIPVCATPCGHPVFDMNYSTCTIAVRTVVPASSVWGYGGIPAFRRSYLLGVRYRRFLKVGGILPPSAGCEIIKQGKQWKCRIHKDFNLTSWWITDLIIHGEAKKLLPAACTVVCKGKIYSVRVASTLHTACEYRCSPSTQL